VEDWSVDPYDWGTFLCTVFDEWYREDLGMMYVNFFDAMVEIWMGSVSPCAPIGLCAGNP
jgi:uncharacterized protein